MTPKTLSSGYRTLYWIVRVLMILNAALFITLFVQLMVIFDLNRESATVQQQRNELRKTISNAELLQRMIGYRGVIHDFKNFVIRGDETYRKNFETGVGKSISLIKQLETSPVGIDRNLISPIEAMLRQYAKMVPIVSAMKAEGRAIPEIDNAVKIDDLPAERALDRIWQQLDREAKGLEQKVHATTVSIEKAIDWAAVTTAVLVLIIPLMIIFQIIKSRRSMHAVNQLETLRSVLDSMDEGLVLFLENGLIVDMNDMARKILRLSEQTTDHQSIEKYLPGILSVQLETQTELQPFKNGTEVETFGNQTEWFRFQCMDSLERPHDTVVSIVEVSSSDPRLFLLAVRPVKGSLGLAMTSRDELERATLSKNRFLGRMSHELRTPLNAIIGYSECMTEGIFGPVMPEKYGDMVSHIHTAGNHMNELIEDVLEFSRLESGNVEVKLEEVDLGECAKSAEPILSPLADSKEIRVLWNIPEGSNFMTVGQPRAIRQIVINLVTNAIHYNSPGGMVKVEVSNGRSGPKLVVEDDGDGIDKNDIKRIFEPFERVHSNHLVTNKGSAGLGLGLTIVRQLLAVMGAYVTVKSEPGKGSRFTVQFALHDLPVSNILDNTSTDNGTQANQ